MRRKSFEVYLRKQNLSENTMRSYLFSVETYKKMFKKVNSKKISQYKEFLIKNYKPQTVNLRLIGLSKYLRFLKKEKLIPKLVKEQRKTFLQNVISNGEYELLKKSLKNDNQIKWLFIVRYLALTGVRVSELVQIKIEHVLQGFADIQSKGKKIRRIYFPKELQRDTRNWISFQGLTKGFLFLNRSGRPLTTRGIAAQLKHFAQVYNIEETVVYPHSFRHFFAKNFLERNTELLFLRTYLVMKASTPRAFISEKAQRSRKTSLIRL